MVQHAPGGARRRVVFMLRTCVDPTPQHLLVKQGSERTHVDNQGRGSMFGLHSFRAACVAVLLVLALSACGSYELRGGAIEPPSAAPDFTLTDHTGQPYRLSDQRGKVVLIFFGFTSCPDICPTALADLAAAKQRLGDAGENVEVVLITVDPERDTAEELERYVTAFDPSFVGLYGTREQLEQVYKDYGVTVIRRDLPDSALGYTVDHSGFIYVIDRAGNWRELFSHGAAVDDIASDVRYLARERIS